MVSVNHVGRADDLGGHSWRVAVGLDQAAPGDRERALLVFSMELKDLTLKKARFGEVVGRPVAQAQRRRKVIVAETTDEYRSYECQ